MVSDLRGEIKILSKQKRQVPTILVKTILGSIAEKFGGWEGKKQPKSEICELSPACTHMSTLQVFGSGAG